METSRLITALLFAIYCTHATHKHEFACVKSFGNDDTSQCSTLVASCDENEKILVDKLHYGMRNESANCSTNQTDCKTFPIGCCVSIGYNDIHPTNENSDILQLCHGQRNCSFQPSRLDLQTLQSKDFFMFEYFCVNDTDVITICDKKDTVRMNQKTINLIYIPKKDFRTYETKKCIIELYPSSDNSSIEVTLDRLRILDQDESCTSTRLKISDFLLLCGVFTGLTLQLKGPFNIELEVSDSDTPDEIWISVKGGLNSGISLYVQKKLPIKRITKWRSTIALGGDLIINHTSRFYQTKNESETTRDTTESIGCPKWEQTCLAVIITVPVVVLVAIVAVITALLVIRNRFRIHTESKPRKEINSFDSRFYHTVEPHELQVDANNPEHNSTLSNRDVDSQQETSIATDTLQRSNMTGTTGADHNIRAVSHYEKISLAEEDMTVSNARGKTEQSTCVFQQTEIVDSHPKDVFKTDTDEVNTKSEKDPGGEKGRKETIRTAGYDTLTFSKPPRYTRPSYDSIDRTFSPVTEHI